MKPAFVEAIVVVERPRLVVLFCLEKVGIPAGILPLAFSDMPRSWDGTASTGDDNEGALEWSEMDADLVDASWVFPSSDSSSSPMANALLSSGTSRNEGDLCWMLVGLLTSSLEPARNELALLAWLACSFWRFS